MALHDLCLLSTESFSCESLIGQIPLTKVYGVTPDISIIMMHTVHQSVYYASHNQSFPSISEEKHAYWVGFGEHVGDAISHKLLDSSSQKIIYRSTFVPRMISIQTSVYLLIQGSQWDPTSLSLSHLLNPIRILTNLLANPWPNTIQMIS